MASAKICLISSETIFTSSFLIVPPVSDKVPDIHRPLKSRKSTIQNAELVRWFAHFRLLCGFPIVAGQAWFHAPYWAGRHLRAGQYIENDPSQIQGNALMNIINALHRLLVKVRCKLPVGWVYRIYIHSLDDTRLFGVGLLNWFKEKCGQRF